MGWDSSDYGYMARAIQLARRGLFTTDPNPRVGCVIVQGQTVIAEGWHSIAGDDHAEIVALKHAKQDPAGATCYVSLEPCSHHGKTPPCTDALIEAGVHTVVTAMQDPNPQVSGRGLSQLQAAGIKTEVGLLAAEAAALNPGYCKRMQSSLPYVRCKIGMSLDGRMALGNGKSQWITAKESRLDAQRLRARSSAILTGIGTVLSDDPSLTVRDVDTDGQQPLRVVMDRHLRMPEDARMIQLPGKTLVFCNEQNGEKKANLLQAGVQVIATKTKDNQLDLHAALTFLAEDKEINEILVEAGPTLTGALLQAGLVDELIIYTAPKLMGNRSKGICELPEFEDLSDCIRLQYEDVRLVGQDLRITAKLLKDN